MFNLAKILKLKRLVLEKVAKQYKYLLLVSMFFLGACEEIYQPENNYIKCEWIQYAEEKIYDCEDVSWCDETIYAGEKVRRTWMYYLNDKPDIDNSLFIGGVDRIFYWSFQAECINYDSDNEEIGCTMDGYGYFDVNTSGYLISFKENN